MKHINPRFKPVVLAMSLAAIYSPMTLAQQEAVVVLRSTVTGNQEQPKVLYIVPWQHPDSPESLYRPVETLVNDLFQPVDREEFIRELKYREKLEKPADPEP